MSLMDKMQKEVRGQLDPMLDSSPDKSNLVRGSSISDGGHSAGLRPASQKLDRRVSSIGGLLNMQKD